MNTVRCEDECDQEDGPYGEGTPKLHGIFQKGRVRRQGPTRHLGKRYGSLVTGMTGH